MPIAPYSILYSDPAHIPAGFTIQPGQVDTTSTSLELPGFGLVDYGQHVDQSLFHILENFSSPTAPVHQTKGQLWYDTGSSLLKVWNGTLWTITGGAIVQAVQPSPPTTGEFWFDTTVLQNHLNYYDGTMWVRLADKTYVDNAVSVGSLTSSLDTIYLRLNGSNSMTGTLDLNSHNIANVSNPRVGFPQDAATKTYVDTGFAAVSSGGAVLPVAGKAGDIYVDVVTVPNQIYISNGTAWQKVFNAVYS